MSYINPYRSFVTTVHIAGLPPFDMQFYGVGALGRPGDLNETEVFELVGAALRRRRITAEYSMSAPRADVVLARVHRQKELWS
jgi:hypothetical protein